MHNPNFMGCVGSAPKRTRTRILEDIGPLNPSSCLCPLANRWAYQLVSLKIPILTLHAWDLEAQLWGRLQPDDWRMVPSDLVLSPYWKETSMWKWNMALTTPSAKRLGLGIGEVGCRPYTRSHVNQEKWHQTTSTQPKTKSGEENDTSLALRVRRILVSLSQKKHRQVKFIDLRIWYNITHLPPTKFDSKNP